MPWRENFYSRMVAWLKVLLPLAALGLLSTLFLFSKNIDPTTTIPFTTIDLKERAREEGITAPEFAGTTEEGHLVSFHAASARPDPDRNTRALAEKPDARIELTSGTLITIRANDGIVDESADRTEMEGNVVVRTSTGYIVETDVLISALRTINVETPGPVEGDGPPGHFTAGRMLITDLAPQEAGPGSDAAAEPAIHLLFTDGVKLLYDPQKIRE